jgi:glycerophosphoryl diester phosphodiesterase
MTLEYRPEPFRSLVLGVLRDFRRLFVPLAWFEILFKTGVAILSIVGGTILLAILSRSTGSSAVTNSDIVDFLLSPVGVLVVAMLGFFTILFIMLEHLGVMAILANFQRGMKITTLGITGTLAALLVPLLQIKAKGLAFLALTATPLAILGGLTYAALLSHHDINYYLADRPPSFLVAIVIGGLLGAIFLSLLSYAYVRTVFLFPILLYEDLPPGAAMKESFRRTKGTVGRLGLILLGWQIIGVILSAAVVWGFATIAGLLLHLVASRFWTLVPLVALLLALHGVILALLSFVLISLHCILIIGLYRERNQVLGVICPEPASTNQEVLDVPRLRSLLRFWKMGILASLAVFVILCVSVFRQFGTPETVVVTAHKGFSWAAPENSLSAIRKAIEVGADYAEIDVQETADGEIILNHDRDLMRVAGVSRRISEMTLAEVRRASIGGKFGPAFSQERVPTLKEVIALARDRIKIQIELKFYDKDRKLAGDVARLLAREHFESQCVVSSLHYDGLIEARHVNHQLRTAAIVTFSIGDIDRLDVDGVSVNARYLSDRLIRAVRSRHKNLYAWTVDDPRQMITLMERGVPNIVTNRPDLLVALRAEFAGLGDINRRLLAARYLLGLEPTLGSGSPAEAPYPDDLDQP